MPLGLKPRCSPSCRIDSPPHGAHHCYIYSIVPTRHETRVQYHLHCLLLPYHAPAGDVNFTLLLISAACDVGTTVACQSGIVLAALLECNMYKVGVG